ncbi:hypothetical protein MAM1_1189d11502, partial [Mucor ambiguus]
MPDFCRNYCQSSVHCRADCPDDYKKWARCCYHYCNATGHVAKNCRRNDNPNKIRAVNKLLSKPGKGSQEANGGASTGKKKVNPKLLLQLPLVVALLAEKKMMLLVVLPRLLINKMGLNIASQVMLIVNVVVLNQAYVPVPGSRLMQIIYVYVMSKPPRC